MTAQSLRRSMTAVALVVLGVLVPPDVLAQSPGGDEGSQTATPAQQLADAPPPGTWLADGTLGFQLQDGRTDTRGYNVDLIFAHSTAGGTLIRFEAELIRAEYRAPDSGDFTSVDDREYLGATFVPKLTDQLGIMLLGSWQRDDPVGLEHRTMAQGGLYLELVQSPRLQIMIAPLVGAGTQDNAQEGGSAGIFNIGAIQSLTWHATETFTVQSYFKGHQDLREGDDFSVAFNASGMAGITSHVGLKIYYKLSVEGIHAPDRDNWQHDIGAGISIKFPG